MKKLLSAITLLALLSIDHATAQLPNIDRTCTNCDRRYLDSLNVYDRRPIRVNQAGFRPQDNKYAYVADTKVRKFPVVETWRNLEHIPSHPFGFVAPSSRSALRSTSSAIRQQPELRRFTKLTLRRFRQQASTSLLLEKTPRPHSMFILLSITPFLKTRSSSLASSAAAIQIPSSTGLAT